MGILESKVKEIEIRNSQYVNIVIADNIIGKTIQVNGNGYTVLDSGPYGYYKIQNSNGEEFYYRLEGGKLYKFNEQGGLYEVRPEDATQTKDKVSPEVKGKFQDSYNVLISYVKELENLKKDLNSKLENVQGYDFSVLTSELSALDEELAELSNISYEGSQGILTLKMSTLVLSDIKVPAAVAEVRDVVKRIYKTLDSLRLQAIQMYKDSSNLGDGEDVRNLKWEMAYIGNVVSRYMKNISGHYSNHDLWIQQSKEDIKPVVEEKQLQNENTIEKELPKDSIVEKQLPNEDNTETYEEWYNRMKDKHKKEINWRGKVDQTFNVGDSVKIGFMDGLRVLKIYPKGKAGIHQTYLLEGPKNIVTKRNKKYLFDPYTGGIRGVDE